MDEDIKTQLAVLTERVQNLNEQIKRFISHLESEQRVTTNISKRVDAVEKDIRRMEEEKARTERKSEWNVQTVMSLVAIGISAATLLVMVFKNG